MNSTQPQKGLNTATDGGVVTITIDHGRANSVDPDLIDEFLDLLPRLTNDAQVRCIVIRGTGRIFVAGADIAVMRKLTEDIYRAMRRWVEVQRLLEKAPQPVVAALNGHALGGGAELALACDLRIMHENATFGFPEMALGLFPGAGGSQRLPRLLGPHLAKRLMIDARRLHADEAQRLGLVDRVAGDDFDAVVREEAQRLAALPTATIGLLKSAVDQGWGLPMEDAMAVEEEYVMKTIRTADAAEGLQSFLEKRTPVFKGR